MVGAPLTQIQTQDAWLAFARFAEELDKRITTELSKRGVKVYNVLTSIVDVVGGYVRYVVEVKVILREVARIYYEGLYEMCSDVANDIDASEEEVEKMIDECVKEEVDRYDYEYGYPLFTFRYRDGRFSAKLEVEIDEGADHRTYYDVLVVQYENQCLAKYIGCGIDYETNIIVDKVMQLLKAVKALMDT